MNNVKHIHHEKGRSTSNLIIAILYFNQNKYTQRTGLYYNKKLTFSTNNGKRLNLRVIDKPLQKLKLNYIDKHTI